MCLCRPQVRACVRAPGCVCVCVGSRCVSGGPRCVCAGPRGVCVCEDPRGVCAGPRCVCLCTSGVWPVPSQGQSLKWVNLGLILAWSGVLRS